MKKLLIFIGLLLTFTLSGQISTGVVSHQFRVVTEEEEPGEVPSFLTSDGHTVAWYIADDQDDVIHDGSNQVSEWSDHLGTTKDLIQASEGTEKPTWSSDGILFDPANYEYMHATFTLAQPTKIYIVYRNVTWTEMGAVFDGASGYDSGKLQNRNATPEIDASAGDAKLASTQLAVNAFGIVQVLFDGASSTLIVDDHAAVTGDAGDGDMGGIVVGAAGGAPSGGYESNVQIKEIIIRDADDTSGDRTSIYNYLKAKYGL